MVKIARRNVEKAGLSSRVRFMVEDANKMPLEDSSFDLIVSTGSLHHWKKPLHVINEVYRVLKDGGKHGYTTCVEMFRKTLLLRSWESISMEG
jgi:ubiquinone/menaquinone biosynthesis C-methylase UbiE